MSSTENALSVNIICGKLFLILCSKELSGDHVIPYRQQVVHVKKKKKGQILVG